MTTSSTTQQSAARAVGAVESDQQDTPRVRAAAPPDLAAVEALLTASDLPLDGVKDALATFVVAESGTDVVGVAGLEVCCDNALLRSVAVRPEWRSHGVGRALVTRVIADAESRGIHALYLLTTTADRYFPSFGFRTISRDEVPAGVRETAEFREACPASATVMCRACDTTIPPN
ncbi:MAG: GNAT family N-acetyltransferase [Gemmatimonadetes bacterium]|nr:MAG: GNAT family N-acetyltransferase [Gemmatimonadota bacterium]HMC56243.1 arsenic resistance N-acetyltransferase ArsN2 [Gemmatimonadaceae bacterium]